MRCQRTLEYFAKQWPNAAAWVKDSLPAQSAPARGEVNKDLVVSPAPADQDHLLLIQCGLLYWIASGRPERQPALNWRGTKAEIRKEIQSLSPQAIKAWLQGVEAQSAAVPVVPPPVLPQPRPPVPPPRHRPAVPAAQMLPRANAGAPVLPAPAPLPHPQAVTGALRHGSPPSSLVNAVARSGDAPVTALPTQRPVAVARRPSMGPARVAAPPEKAAGGIDEDKKRARAALATKTLRSVVVMDAYVGEYQASDAAKKLCDMKRTSPLHANFLASQGTLPKDVEGWDALGKNTIRWEMGNCQQCMAAAFHALKHAEGWSTPIELVHVGRGGVGHHFLVVGRPKATSVHIGATKDWGKAFVVDLWYQNLYRPGRGDKAALGTEAGPWVDGVADCKDHKYLAGQLGTAKVDLYWAP